MTVVIMGGNSFIGGHLINLFTERGYQVTAVDYLDLDNEVRIKNNATRIVRADYSDTKVLLETLIKNDARFVIDLIAEQYYENADNDAENKVLMQKDLWGFANRIYAIFNYWSNLPEAQKQRFVYLATFSLDIFGKLSDSEDINENTPIEPISTQGASQAFKLHLIHAWNKSFRLPVISTFASKIYGPYQLNSSLSAIINNALEEKPIIVQGNGKQIRDFLYINDYCNAIYLAATKGKIGSRYCISTNTAISIIDVVNLLCSIMDEIIPRKDAQSYRDLIKFSSAKKLTLPRKTCNSSKICVELGFIPMYSLEQGIRNTIEWFISNSQNPQELT